MGSSVKKERKCQIQGIEPYGIHIKFYTFPQWSSHQQQKMAKRRNKKKRKKIRKIAFIVTVGEKSFANKSSVCGTNFSKITLTQTCSTQQLADLPFDSLPFEWNFRKLPICICSLWLNQRASVLCRRLMRSVFVCAALNRLFRLIFARIWVVRLSTTLTYTHMLFFYFAHFSTFWAKPRVFNKKFKMVT